MHLLTRSITAIAALTAFGTAGMPARALSSPPAIHVGAVFPLRGAMAPLAREEYRGVEIARDLVNTSGGVHGRRIVFDTRELDQPDGAAAVMQALHARGDTVVLGAYSSALSIPASAAAAGRDMVYWEAGAVADRLTGRGLPLVFRVGASGSNLGSNSARFAATQLAPRLHRSPHALRIAVVHDNDSYATSVAAAAVRQSRADGMQVVSDTAYDAYAVNWQPVLRAVRAARPDILILASHILDGVAFRRAFVRAHLHVGAFIGSTMAQCVPEFGALMGKDAVGVFASDRPNQSFNPRALGPNARAVYSRFAAVWRRQTGQARPSEEGLAGFSAAWALFHVVLPRVSSLSPASVAAAARAVDLPRGALPNGAGLRFARDRAHLGQNLRAAAVIWQWQAVRQSVVVWPSIYATGTVRMVPLPR